jgi:lipopolysaccharide cholinephosphotransferase
VQALKKLVLFGAGQGAKAYIKQLKANEQVIAVCDNDSVKHGSFFASYPVISPSQLKDLKFDQLVITTQWFQEVRQQLTEHYHIAPELMHVPDKHQLKSAAPFTDAATHQLARDSLCLLSEMAEQHQVHLVADFGTLLGLIRNQDILPWDDDIDFSANPAEQPSVLELLQHFVKQQAEKLNLNWQLTQLVDKQQQIASYTLTLHAPDYRSFDISVCFRRLEDNKSIHLASLGLWYAPASHFEKTEQFHWRDTAIQIPSNPKEYLAFVYGADWRKEKKHMVIGDYAHTQSVAFEQVQQAGLHSQAIVRKALVFGTGTAGERAYEYYKALPEYELTGWLDNNKTKHGQTFFSLPIYAPDQLAELVFDKIIIASTFHSEIRKQLTEQLAIAPSCIENIPSHVLKGTGDLSQPERFNFARELMLTLCRLFNEHKIPYYIDHGTLLGVYRDGDLLPWDNDIDFAIDAEHLSAVQQILWQSLPQFKIKHCRLNHWTMTAAYDLIKMPGSNQYRKRIIKFYEYSDDPVSKALKVDLIVKYKDGDQRYWLVGATVLNAPDDLTKTTVPFEFFGTKVQIPKYTENYLTLLYKNWKTPVKRWDHSMYSNITTN